MDDEIKLTHPNIVETAPTRSHRTGHVRAQSKKCFDAPSRCC